MMSEESPKTYEAPGAGQEGSGPEEAAREAEGKVWMEAAAAAAHGAAEGQAEEGTGEGREGAAQETAKAGEAESAKPAGEAPDGPGQGTGGQRADGEEGGKDTVNDGAKDAADEAADDADARETQTRELAGNEVVERLKQAEERLLEYQDRYLRLQAEFENYKKRGQKERQEQRRYLHTPVLKEVLKIADNLERALHHAEESGSIEGIVEGIRMVTTQCGEIFQSHGMARIKTRGEVFDPVCHEAVGVVENPELAPNTVVEECESGYWLHDRVLRAARVMVVKNQPAEGKAAGEKTGGQA